MLRARVSQFLHSTQWQEGRALGECELRLVQWRVPCAGQVALANDAKTAYAAASGAMCRLQAQAVSREGRMRMYAAVPMFQIFCLSYLQTEVSMRALVLREQGCAPWVCMYVVLMIVPALQLFCGMQTEQ